MQPAASDVMGVHSREAMRLLSDNHGHLVARSRRALASRWQPQAGSKIVLCAPWTSSATLA